jgi:hypothetical protein
MDASTETDTTDTKRKERNRRHYEKKKQAKADAALPQTIETLLAQRRDLETKIAALREQAMPHVHIPSEEGKALLGHSKRLAQELVKQCDGDWELVLMVSENLRDLALEPKND